MNPTYVEKSADAYRIAGTRMSLDSIVYAYWNGQTAESIAQSFPSLSLEQVHGALAYYLANRAIVDASLRDAEVDFDKLRAASRDQDPMFYQKLAESSAVRR